MLYNSNFDDSSFKKYENIDSTRLYADPCAYQQNTQDNKKKFKFITTNHVDLLEAKEKLNFYGMTIKDHLFVPSESIDKDSFLRYGVDGGIMTHCNVKNEFGQLPLPTIPSQYQLWHGDIDVEDKFRLSEHLSNKQSNNPRDSTFYNRSFYIFDYKSGIEYPDASKSLEPIEFGTRGGQSTRFLTKKKPT